MRTLVVGGRVVTSTEDRVADVLIEDGRVVSIGDFGELEAEVVVDATDRIVLPGGVDPHTHLDTPVAGTVISDDFRSGSVAGLAGGTTTIVDFAIQEKGRDPREALEKWHRKADGKSAADYAFHQILIDLPDEYLSSLNGLVAEGVTSFKLFMAYPNSWMLDDGSIFRAMRRSAEIGGFIMLHCENGFAIDTLIEEALAANQTDPIHHARTRPALAEEEATRRGIALAEMAGVPVYVVHMSAERAALATGEARSRGVRAYAETCPQYLVLTDEKLEQPHFHGANYVCSPPLRTEDHQEALWRGLRDGSLQTVGTDHAPFFFEQRQPGRSDFTKIPNGLPGIEWRLSLLYHYGVRANRISLNRFVELVSTNAAKLFGLYPRKGEIAPGSDGDLVIFDPQREQVLSAKTQLTNCDYNPYEGMVVTGVPEKVLLGGQIVAENGVFVGEDGSGKFLRCGESAALSSSEIVA